jgi:hypothetical protein
MAEKKERTGYEESNRGGPRSFLRAKSQGLDSCRWEGPKDMTFFSPWTSERNKLWRLSVKFLILFTLHGPTLRAGSGPCQQTE